MKHKFIWTESRCRPALLQSCRIVYPGRRSGERLCRSGHLCMEPTEGGDGRIPFDYRIDSLSIAVLDETVMNASWEDTG